ncbi:hypothetical protein BpHYR1_022491 [Brachionus plicatilis]|uniref:Secreted protein n=1 Tax=Brachionus plicatilis TaxID=10195 RepID=A0A3M7Q023_BRAPC|nr:hypothetical protein BpHYR1_022491 [Brachionus plicatilis]
MRNNQNKLILKTFFFKCVLRISMSVLWLHSELSGCCREALSADALAHLKFNTDCKVKFKSAWQIILSHSS